MDPAAIQELFQDLGPVRCRRMFGGQGLYAGERMFGLEAGGEIFLKVDDRNRRDFEAAGSRPFSYEKDGRRVAMSYWLIPEGAFDDPVEAARWGRLAIEAADRAGRPKRPRRR